MARASRATSSARSAPTRACYAEHQLKGVVDAETGDAHRLRPRPDPAVPRPTRARASSPSRRSRRPCRTCRRRRRSSSPATWAPAPTRCSSSPASWCWRCTWRSWASPSPARPARSGRCAPRGSCRWRCIQSASSISHDAFTTAIALLVVSSALRALDPPEGTSTRALVIEALVLSALLGSVKPIVRGDRRALPAAAARRPPPHRPLAAGVRAGARRARVGAVERRRRATSGRPTPATSASRSTTSAQKHELLHQPWDFGADLVRTGYHELWHWVHTARSPSARASPQGPAILAVLCVAIYVVVVAAARPQPRRRSPLGWLQRGLILLVFLIGVVLVGVAELHLLDAARARPGGGHPTPLLHAAARAAPGGDRVVAVAAGRTPHAPRVPVPVLLAPTLVVFCVIVTFRMY